MGRSSDDMCLPAGACGVRTGVFARSCLPVRHSLRLGRIPVVACAVSLMPRSGECGGPSREIVADALREDLQVLPALAVVTLPRPQLRSAHHYDGVSFAERRAGIGGQALPAFHGVPGGVALLPLSAAVNAVRRGDPEARKAALARGDCGLAPTLPRTTMVSVMTCSPSDAAGDQATIHRWTVSVVCRILPRRWRGAAGS